MNKYLLLALSLCFTLCATPLTAQQPHTSELDSIILSEEIQYGGQVSITLVNANSGKYLYAHRSKEMMTPASVTKILSTGAALQALGKDFRYPTLIYGTGRQVKTTYKGDIIITGFGDPSIGSRYVAGEENRLAEELLKELQRRGIKKVQGHLQINAYLGEEQGTNTNWMLEDIGFYYGAGLWGFNYRDNRFDLKLNTRRRGRRPKLLNLDKNWGLNIKNKMISSRRERLNFSNEAQKNKTKLTIEGSVPRSRRTYLLPLSHPDPARYAVNEIETYLKAHHIKFSKPHRVHYDQQSEKGKLLYAYYSKPLDSLARITNHRSHNLFAEGFAALVANGKPVGESLVKYWQKRLDDPTLSLQLADGSGLSRKDQMTTATLSAVLLDLFNVEKQGNSTLLKTLPRVGVEGTVKHLLSEEELPNAYLKSGSMTGVVSYAGYVQYNGEWYVIAIISNNFDRNANARNCIRLCLKSLFSSERN